MKATYVNAKGARAAARKAGCTNAVVTEVDGRYSWAPKPAMTTRSAVSRIEQNGVKRPKAGGLCAAVWDYLDAHNEGATAKNIRVVAEQNGWNLNNAQIEFYQWRKFNGISGRSQ